MTAVAYTKDDPVAAGEDADRLHEERADAADQGGGRAGRSARRPPTSRALATMPGKPELYAKLLFLLQAPMVNLVHGAERACRAI